LSLEKAKSILYIRG